MDECILCGGSSGLVEVNGYSYCKNCLPKYFSKCEVCGEYHLQGFIHRRAGRLYQRVYRNILRVNPLLLYSDLDRNNINMCDKCYHKCNEAYFKGGEVLRCHRCSAYTHEGVALLSEGKAYCECCKDKVSSCVGCGGMVYAEPNVDGIKGTLCGTCVNENPDWLRCGCCGKYHSIQDDRTYCTKHNLCTTCSKDYDVCDSCKGIYPKREVVLKGDVHVCYNCSKDVCNSCGTQVIKHGLYDNYGKYLCVQCSAKNNNPFEGAWDYRPERFYLYKSEVEVDKGKYPLYLGFENEEMTLHPPPISKYEHLAMIQQHFNERDVYTVFDGSIGGQHELHGSTGFEFVAHPRTLQSHKDMDWSHLFTKYTVVHQTCGMHIHLSRSSFREPQHLLKLMKFVYSNSSFIKRVAERGATEYTSSIRVADVAKEAEKRYKKKSDVNRRVKVNLCNKLTIELRFFANVNSTYKLYKNLEFADALFHFSRVTPLKSCTKSSLFKVFLKEQFDVYPNLCKFLKLK